MRGVLCLFEGVATGAADGYGRLLGRPAATLLHLGPGLANGLANLHNARRAHTPVVNIVGDHATYHRRFDPPLESDIDALAEHGVDVDPPAHPPRGRRPGHGRSRGRGASARRGCRHFDPARGRQLGKGGGRGGCGAHPPFATGAGPGRGRRG